MNRIYRWVYLYCFLMSIAVALCAQTGEETVKEGRDASQPNSARCDEDSIGDGEEVDLTELSLEELMEVEVVFSASKYEQEIDHSPAAVNVITADEIRKSCAKTIPDLLKRFPGVWTWTKTRTDQDVGMLGLVTDENPRVLYLLDGQPISTPMFEGMQWPQFPITLDEIERIEVVRGGGSALYGANALTGVINIISKSAVDRPMESYSYIGEDGIQHHTFTLAKRFDKLNLSVTGGYRQTGKREHFDSAYNRGEQNNYSTPVLNTRLDFEISDEQHLSFLSGYTSGDGGYGASPGDASIDHVEDWENMIFQGHYTYAITDALDLDFKASYQQVEQQNFRPYQTGNPEKYHVMGVRYNAEGYLITKAISANTLLFGTAYQHLFTNSIGETSNLQPSRRYGYDLNGIFVQDEYAVTDSLSLTGSVRYDFYDDIDNELTTRGTLMYMFDDENTVRFSAGKSYRRPDIYSQHYSVSWPGGYFRGMPNLPPQSAINYELEYRTRIIPGHTVKVEVFQIRLKDVYFSDTIAAGPQIVISTTDNEYLIRGVIGEVEGALFDDSIRWYGNATLYHARDDTAHVRMSDVPKYMINGGVRYFPLKKDLYASLDAHYQDDFEAVTDTTVTDNVNGIPGGMGVGSFTTVDTKIGYSPWEDVEFSLSVVNLLNDRHYEFPLHQRFGRTVYAGVRIRW